MNQLNLDTNHCDPKSFFPPDKDLKASLNVQSTLEALYFFLFFPALFFYPQLWSLSKNRMHATHADFNTARKSTTEKRKEGVGPSIVALKQNNPPVESRAEPL